MSFRCVQITSRLSSAILSSPFSSLHCSSFHWRCPFVSLARPLPASRIRMRPPSSASKLALSWPLSPTFDRARGQSAKVSRRWDTSVNFYFFSPFKSPAGRRPRSQRVGRIRGKRRGEKRTWAHFHGRRGYLIVRCERFVEEENLRWFSRRSFLKSDVEACIGRKGV